LSCAARLIKLDKKFNYIFKFFSAADASRRAELLELPPPLSPIPPQAGSDEEEEEEREADRA